MPNQPDDTRATKVEREEEPMLIRGLRSTLEDARRNLSEHGASERIKLEGRFPVTEIDASLAWLDRRPEPPPAAPIPSVQGEGKVGEASETMDRVRRILGLPIGAEVLPTIRGLRGMQRDAEQERDRLRHSENEQQVEIARLTELHQRSEAEREFFLKMIGAPVDDPVEVNGSKVALGKTLGEAIEWLRCELAKAQERNASLQHRLELSHGTNRLVEQELRDERERVAAALPMFRQAITYSSYANRCEYLAEGIKLLQPPTASAKEGEECRFVHQPTGDGTENWFCSTHGVNTLGDSPPTKCTGKTPTVESGAEPVCRHCNDSHLMTLGDEESGYRNVMCTHCPRPCQKCRAGGTGAYCERTPCSCDCHKKPAHLWDNPKVALEPVPQASAAEQPTDRLAEMARRAGPLPTTFLAGSPLMNEQAPSPVGGGDAAPLPRATKRVGELLRNIRVAGKADPGAYKNCDMTELSWEPQAIAQYLDELVAALEKRLTGEHDAREGKT